ncbi:hypothetical protein T484DRAFT_3497960 [Baffinella frigidus]|nr:hypothetical protein T484DRAFT_3497960 [Cryptophyta sp. CCMP2293]
MLHQANCCTEGARGLAKVLFEKWPSANIYKAVVHLLAQVGPGKPRNDKSDDSKAKRLHYFRTALTSFAAAVADDPPKTIAMPFLIGCSLAGGHWPDYYSAIKEFSTRHGIIVRLYDIERKSLDMKLV